MLLGITLAIFASLFVLVPNAAGQKVLVVDGAEYPSSLHEVGQDVIDVAQKLRNLPVKADGLLRLSESDYYIKVPVKGRFIEAGVETRAYAYGLWKQGSAKSTEGIILVNVDPKTRKMTAVMNVAFPTRNTAKLVVIPDMNGDGLDELGIIANQKKATDLSVLSLAGKKFTALGKLRIYDLNATPAFRMKVFVEPSSGSARLVGEKEIITGKGWTAAAPAQLELQPDDAAYSVRVARASIFKLLLFVTFVVQMLGFFALLGLLLYEFITAVREPTESETPVANADDGTTTDGEKRLETKAPDSLPVLDPLNCENCASPLPLVEGEIICPSCGTRTKAPDSYFDVARVRGELREKIRLAAAYLHRASLLTSGWMRLATGLLTVWVAITPVVILILSGNDNFEPYQSLVSSPSIVEVFVVVGTLTTCFWMIALAFTFFLWGPRIRKNIPTIELGENVGKAESKRCPQCGGGISYEADDIASVCGYCGTEVYRARLAWALRDLTNQASRKAEFSLLEAKEAAQSAVDTVTDSPRVFMGLLILGGGLYLAFWLISALLHLLGRGVGAILEPILDALGLL
ncbi:MAG: hypothetical protein KF756_00170 [Acidobacteria bacterium]|nr:hypothetical protein [Acidobacteriota bacterium]